ncbi:permease prefix domain 1-containing protein [Phytohabitans sp. ZYX-F-186]|uniref:Permease prefix domain 1-containing protein n=1 Tax=Phytohabitans maris TaxID=3071409 RepID=A0ABU0ZU76_9ACTN|nr:permease prefix domain 1-containing protein [Phytohabitans sp. ZYX-F-186]MDQ7910037.1 permease prefix domain 1-containing protein [Phytohabitans sp. ZYX-F-186]
MPAPIDEYVRTLDRALSGPGRLKGDMLREARHGLADAAEAYQEEGLPRAEAERLAVAEFGEVRALAPAYQAELGLGAARRLALKMVLVPALFTTLADFMWRGSPWSTSTTAERPPAGYLMISQAQDYLGYVWAGLALAAYLWLTWSARRGRPTGRVTVRAIGAGALSIVGLTWLAGTVIYVWSLSLWDAALTWPPMVAGGLLVGAAVTWLAHSAVTCLVAAPRRVPAGEPVRS